MYNLRSFDATDSDYELFVSFWNRAFADDPVTAESMKKRDSRRDPSLPNHRDFIIREGKAQAFGMYFQNPTAKRANKYKMQILVPPEYDDQQGIREFYLKHVEGQLADKDLKAIQFNTRENYTDTVAFLQNNGFDVVMRYPESSLDVQGVRPYKIR